MKTPPIYVLKLKYFESDEWLYFTESFIMDAKSLDSKRGLNLDMFIYTDEQSARKTMLSLIMQRREHIQAYKMVELSHYPPYPEHEVVWYQEYEHRREN